MDAEDRLRQAQAPRRALAAICALALTVFLGGCGIRNLDLVADSARNTFTSGISPDVAVGIQRLREMPYAQMYGRFGKREEAVFILAEQNKANGRDLWIGGLGVSLVMQGADLIATDGLAHDLVASESIRSGAVQLYLDGTADAVLPAEKSVRLLKASASDEWFEQIATVERVQEVYYQGLAYSGPAIRVTERVRTTGQRGSFRRETWIESSRRAVLRVHTQMSAASDPIVLEWIRVPDRADPR
ncbi:MAG: YjbF family lipoprotein [Nevskiales bacterium]|nr:YjbF family lipoprotein [Nevskiales bacterium]